MGAVMHQYGQTELACADRQNAQQKRKRVGPNREKRHCTEDERPGVNYPKAAFQIRARTYVGQLFWGKIFICVAHRGAIAQRFPVTD